MDPARQIRVVRDGDGAASSGPVDVDAYNVDAPSPDPDDPKSSSPDKAAKKAPEPPRWRFVNEAKKSSGYSSVHAGSYVEGRTSDELGAKYTAPDISLYQPKKEEAEAKRVSFKGLSSSEYYKEDSDVGRLDASASDHGRFAKQESDVGRLSINESTSSHAESFSGSFAGLPQSPSVSGKSRAPYREWDVNVEVGPKKDREREWYDGEVRDGYKIPEGQDPGKKSGGVGRLRFHGAGSSAEGFDGEVTKGSQERTETSGNGTSVDGPGDAREGALMFTNAEDGSASGNQKGDDDSTMLTDPAEEEKMKKKNKWLALLLLLLLAIVVILGVLLGTRDKEEEAAAVAAVGGVLAPPIVLLENETSVPSFEPTASLQPSLSPTRECPASTKSFSIEHSPHIEQTSSAETMDAMTWKVMDSCTGEVISQCLPCSLKSLFPIQSGLRSGDNDGPARLGLRNSTQCLPAENEYVLEIVPAKESEPCCGFDPVSSIMSYDNIVVRYGSFDSGLENEVKFGEREVPCTSKTPSASPTPPPTNPPTPEKICSTEKQFNLCLAVDMSGSVCNNGSGSECGDCQAGFLSSIDIFNLFTNECRDSSVSEDSCCKNFDTVKDFSSLMVKLLGDFDAEKSFSVVQFATSARLVSSRLSSSDQAVSVIEQLDYTGGLTNHAAAIQTCQRSFPSDDREDFIMLVTDGVPSEPGFDPEGAAIAAAATAKADGTFVIPVFISPSGNDWTALDFMRRLSSDRSVFDVTDFDSLDTLQGKLVEQVSCS